MLKINFLLLSISILLFSCKNDDDTQANPEEGKPARITSVEGLWELNIDNCDNDCTPETQVRFLENGKMRFLDTRLLKGIVKNSYSFDGDILVINYSYTENETCGDNELEEEKELEIINELNMVLTLDENNVFKGPNERKIIVGENDCDLEDKDINENIRLFRII